MKSDKTNRKNFLYMVVGVLTSLLLFGRLSIGKKRLEVKKDLRAVVYRADKTSVNSSMNT